MYFARLKCVKQLIVDFRLLVVQNHSVEFALFEFVSDFLLVYDLAG
jgi:hypothetical protein